MKGTTHLAIGLATIAVAKPDVVPAGLVLLGSLLPDFDEEHSLLGRYNPFARFFMKHRGILHYWKFWLIIAVFEVFVTQAIPWLGVGVTLHLVFDALNPSGIPRKWPNSEGRIRFPITVKSRNFIANALIQLACLATVAWVAMPTVEGIGSKLLSFLS